jgi:hypothetical protein
MPLDPAKAVELLRRQFDTDVESCAYYDPKVIEWFNFTQRLVAEIFGELHSNVSEFGLYPRPSSRVNDSKAWQQSIIGSRKGLLRSFIEQVQLLPSVRTPQVTVEREGFYVAGQTFDALLRASKLFASAAKSISLVDNYFGEEVLHLLSGKQAGVATNVLTRPKGGVLSPTVQSLCAAFSKQFGGLEVRNTSAFHDRFLVVDETDFYHFGASFNGLGKSRRSIQLGQYRLRVHEFASASNFERQDLITNLM